MKLSRALPTLLAGLLLATTASAQDLPYYQEQKLTVIFGLSEDLVVRSWDGSQVLALQRGAYRFDASQRSQSILNAATLADETGPFSRYQGRLRGQIKPLFGGAAIRDAGFGLKITEADFNATNVVRAGELSFEMRVQLGSSSSTTTRYVGDVKRRGGHVRGTLDSYYSVQTGKIRIWHVKLSLEDHLPIKKPLAHFPETIEVEAHTAYADDPDYGHEIEDRSWGFDLTRASMNRFGKVSYDNQADFPMVQEDDYYGNYESGPHDASVVIKESGEVWISLGWGLSGRYHGWSYTYTATLSAAEFERLRTQGSVRVSGSASYSYGDEDYSVDLSTSAEFTFKASMSAPASATTGSSGGLLGGLGSP